MMMMFRPTWISVLFLQWLPWLLRMSRPGRPLTRKNILLQSKLEKLEREDKQGNSLLAVLDMEDEVPGSGKGTLRKTEPPPLTKQPTKYTAWMDADKWTFPNIKVHHK